MSQESNTPAASEPLTGPFASVPETGRRRLYAKKFGARYEHRLVEGGIGHNLPQEAPQAFAQAIVDVDRF